jgi:hypothetical protein
MRGDGQNQLKISAPHPVTETYRLIPLLAAQISLDSPFNVVEISKSDRLFTDKFIEDNFLRKDMDLFCRKPN